MNGVEVMTWIRFVLTSKTGRVMDANIILKSGTFATYINKILCHNTKLLNGYTMDKKQYVT